MKRKRRTSSLCEQDGKTLGGPYANKKRNLQEMIPRWHFKSKLLYLTSCTETQASVWLRIPRWAVDEATLVPWALSSSSNKKSVLEKVSRGFRNDLDMQASGLVNLRLEKGIGAQSLTSVEL